MRYCQLLLVLLLASVHVDCTPTMKCRDGTERKDHRCYVDYDTQETWCDDSNFTRIPRPTDISGFMDPAESIRLFFNSTCLDDLKSELAPFVYLEAVNLDSNKLKRINDNSFSKCTSLTTIILSRNQITDISGDAFAGLTKLETLSLSGNRLTRISVKIFSKLQNLKVLSLSYNRIEQIETNAFHSLSKLESLDLSGNKLTRIEWGYHAVFKNLESLNLQGNELTLFNGNDLQCFIKLTYLNLAGNKISCITGSDSLKKRLLVSLQLSDNHLKHLDSDWFRSTWQNGKKPAVKSYVSGNPWKCDCSAYNYWHMLTREIVTEEWREALAVTCYSPDSVRGQYLHTIDESYFDSCAFKKEIKNCSNLGQKPDKKNKNVGMSMIILFVVIIIAIFVNIYGCFLCGLIKRRNDANSQTKVTEDGICNRNDNMTANDAKSLAEVTQQFVTSDINLISQSSNNVYHDVDSKVGSQTRRSRYDSGWSSINPEENISFLGTPKHFSFSSDSTMPKALQKTQEPNVSYILHTR